MSLTSKNPEFQKNIWLELSMQRLIMMPLIIIVLLILLSVSIPNCDFENLASFSYVGLVIILLLWGSKVAHDNIISEYNERTWDWQRMSILSPYQLLIGKMFGAPIYNWYGGFICFIFYVFFEIASEKGNFIDLGINSLSFLMLVITLMASSIMFALVRIRKGSARNKLKSGQIIFVLIIFGLSTLSDSFYKIMNVDNYQTVRPFLTRKLIENTFYAIWAVVGLHQAFRHELNYKNSAKLWYLFILTSSVFKGVMSCYQFNDFTYLSNFILFSFLIHAIVISYGLLVFEMKDLTQFRILLKNIKEKNFRFLSYNAPLWVLTFPLIFVGLLLNWIFFSSKMLSHEHNDMMNEAFQAMFSNSRSIPISFFDTFSLMLATFFFVIRDFSLMLFLNFNSKNRRADTAFLLYLFLLYFVFPLISMSNHSIKPLFFPSLEGGNVVCMILPAIEAVLILLLLKKVIKTENKLNN